MTVYKKLKAWLFFKTSANYRSHISKHPPTIDLIFQIRSYFEKFKNYQFLPWISKLHQSKSKFFLFSCWQFFFLYFHRAVNIQRNLISKLSKKSKVFFTCTSNLWGLLLLFLSIRLRGFEQMLSSSLKLVSLLYFREIPRNYQI